MKKTDIKETIIKYVLERLFGHYNEENLYKVTCENVFGNKWRLNLYMRVGESITIPYSFFITFCPAEGILNSVPDIVRDKEAETTLPKGKSRGIY